MKGTNFDFRHLGQSELEVLLRHLDGSNRMNTSGLQGKGLDRKHQSWSHGCVRVVEVLGVEKTT